MTPDERTRLRELAKAATPGPCEDGRSEGPVIAADPDLAVGIEVGRLLREVETAHGLQKAWVTPITLYPPTADRSGWTVISSFKQGTCPTLVDALRALLDALRAR